MPSRADAMVSDLKRLGLKLTPQRMAIVRELADDVTHPTAQALFERLRPAFPTMSFATVYNTLDALARCGLIQTMHSLNVGGEALRFDPNAAPHHHAVCDRCGSVHDVPAPEGATTTATLPGLVGFRVQREQRIYRGLCSQCAASHVS